MPSAPPEDYRDEELLADVIAGLIGDARHVAVGAASPIPATAALLARERGNGRPLRVAARQPRGTPSSPTARASCSTAPARAASTCSSCRGGQIDGEANINLVSIGDYEQPTVRFPGSFGSAYLYYVVPNVILFRIEHSRRTLVPKVDFISAPGASPDNVHRTGGPIALVTNRCLFGFDRDAAALPARERASRPHGRGDHREHRLRVRPARLRCR